MPELKPIIKFVNYKQTSPAKAKRLEAYISALGKTEKKLTASNYLTIGDAKRGLEVIYNRFHPNGQRLYKQGILAFGVPDIAVDTALNVAKDTLRFFDEYPWIMAVHLNKPKRLHAHFLLGTINVHTGKKLSQSLADIKMIRNKYDEVAKEYGLPLFGDSKSIEMSQSTEDVEDEHEASYSPICDKTAELIMRASAQSAWNYQQQIAQQMLQPVSYQSVGQQVCQPAVPYRSASPSPYGGTMMQIGNMIDTLSAVVNDEFSRCFAVGFMMNNKNGGKQQ